MRLMALVVLMAACDKTVEPRSAMSADPAEVKVVRIVRPTPPESEAPPALEAFVSEVEAYVALTEDPTHPQTVALMRLLSEAMKALREEVDDAEDAATVVARQAEAPDWTDPEATTHAERVRVALDEVGWVLFHAVHQLRLGPDVELEVDELRHAVDRIDRDRSFLEQRAVIADVFEAAGEAILAVAVATGVAPNPEQMARNVEEPPTRVQFP